MAISYKQFVTTTQIPEGFDLVCDYAVRHPINHDGGALIRNRSTGMYAMLIMSSIVSVPQEWAKNGPKPFSWLDSVEREEKP